MDLRPTNESMILTLSGLDVEVFYVSQMNRFVLAAGCIAIVRTVNALTNLTVRFLKCSARLKKNE